MLSQTGANSGFDWDLSSIFAQEETKEEKDESTDESEEKKEKKEKKSDEDEDDTSEDSGEVLTCTNGVDVITNEDGH